MRIGGLDIVIFINMYKYLFIEWLWEAKILL